MTAAQVLIQQLPCCYQHKAKHQRRSHLGHACMQPRAMCQHHPWLRFLQVATNRMYAMLTFKRKKGLGLGPPHAHTMHGSQAQSIRQTKGR